MIIRCSVCHGESDPCGNLICKCNGDEEYVSARDIRDEAFAEFLELRGVDTPCGGCGGFGVRTYGSTAQWRGGIGGQMLTQGICDKCWGSGDDNSPWMNLRDLIKSRQQEAVDV